MSVTLLDLLSSTNTLLFSSDRSSRCQDVLRASLWDIIQKIIEKQSKETTEVLGQSSKEAGKQAGKQTSRQALRGHSVGALPCMGLFSKIFLFPCWEDNQLNKAERERDS